MGTRYARRMSHEGTQALFRRAGIRTSDFRDLNCTRGAAPRFCRSAYAPRRRASGVSFLQMYSFLLPCSCIHFVYQLQKRRTPLWS